MTAPKPPYAAISAQDGPQADAALQRNTRSPERSVSQAPVAVGGADRRQPFVVGYDLASQ